MFKKIMVSLLFCCLVNMSISASVGTSSDPDTSNPIYSSEIITDSFWTLLDGGSTFYEFDTSPRVLPAEYSDSNGLCGYFVGINLYGSEVFYEIESVQVQSFAGLNIVKYSMVSPIPTSGFAPVAGSRMTIYSPQTGPDTDNPIYCSEIVTDSFWTLLNGGSTMYEYDVSPAPLPADYTQPNGLNGYYLGVNLYGNEVYYEIDNNQNLLFAGLNIIYYNMKEPIPVRGFAPVFGSELCLYPKQ